MALAPTPEAMTQFLNASDIDAEEKHVHLSHLDPGPRIENPECFDG